MTPEKKSIRRKNGIFYSPESLASLLCNDLIFHQKGRVFDPACGDGILLAAAVETALSQGVKLYAICGCDIFQHDLSHIDRKARFLCEDFLSLELYEQFDTIVMNPPYICYGEISSKTRAILEKGLKREFALSGRADLWAYFILKSLRFLSKGGNLGAILPWAFNEAEYAKPIRNILQENFGEIKLTVLNQSHFDHTDTRTLLLWARNFSEKNRNIAVSFSDYHDAKVSHKKITRSDWLGDSIFHSMLSDTNECLVSMRNQYGFIPFSECAKVEIGVVTGANSYFVLTIDEAKENGFSKKNLTPILTSSSEINSLEQFDADKYLIHFGKTASEKQRGYIMLGEKRLLHHRTHPGRRIPWYNVLHGKIPDAFFTYRVGSIPLMAINKNNLLCTNSLHKIYFFDNITDNQRKWMQISMLSIFGQLDIEIKARHYGHGMVKLEPKLLKQILCLPIDKPVPSDQYQKICQCISQQHREQACLIATKLIRSAVSASDVFASKCLNAVNELRQRRGYNPLIFQ